MLHSKLYNQMGLRRLHSPPTERKERTTCAQCAQRITLHSKDPNGGRILCQDETHRRNRQLHDMRVGEKFTGLLPLRNGRFWLK